MESERTLNRLLHLGTRRALSQQLQELMGILIEVSSMMGARWDCHAQSDAEN